MFILILLRTVAKKTIWLCTSHQTELATELVMAQDKPDVAGGFSRVTSPEEEELQDYVTALKVDRAKALLKSKGWLDLPSGLHTTVTVRRCCELTGGGLRVEVSSSDGTEWSDWVDSIVVKHLSEAIMLELRRGVVWEATFLNREASEVLKAAVNMCSDLMSALNRKIPPLGLRSTSLVSVNKNGTVGLNRSRGAPPQPFTLSLKTVSAPAADAKGATGRLAGSSSASPWA